MEDRLPSIIEVGDVLVSIDIFREKFCCDLDACHGECCVEGDAGAPVTIDEVAAIEDAVETVWPGLTASAQAVIDRQEGALSCSTPPGVRRRGGIVVVVGMFVRCI